MHIDFIKEQISAHTMPVNEEISLMLEGDVIVPDVKPDIKEILLAEANARIVKSEETEEKLAVNGTVPVKILYTPEGGGMPCAIDTKFDFKEALALNLATHPALKTRAQVDYIEYSLIHSRKLTMKVGISLKVRGYEENSRTFLCGVPEGSPLKVHTLPLSYYDVVADTQREFTVSETLEIPRAKPEAESIIKMDVTAEKNDCRIMSGKILLKGALKVHVLYCATEEEAGLSTMEYEIPFSEIADVPGLGEDCYCNVTYRVSEVFYSLREDGNGQMRTMSLDVAVGADIVVSKTQNLTVIDDCYSVTGGETVSRETVSFSDVLCEGESYIACKESLALSEDAPAFHGVYSLSVMPKVTNLSVEKDSLVVKGKLHAFVLYGSTEGEDELYSLVGEFDFSHAVPAEGIDETALCECDVEAQNVSFVLSGATEIELRYTLKTYMRAVKEREISLVCDCETEDISAGEDRGLIIYFAKAGDTLWDVAKRYRRDKEKIMAQNSLERETLQKGQKILIPRG